MGNWTTEYHEAITLIRIALVNCINKVVVERLIIDPQIPQ